MNEKQLNPHSIFLIILCALAGYVITFLILDNNLVDNPNRNKLQYLRLTVGDSSVDMKIIPQDSVFYKNERGKATASFKPITGKTLFNRNPTFIIWAQLIMIMMGIAAGAFPVFIWQIGAIKSLFQLNVKQVILKIIYAIALIGFLVAYLGHIQGLVSPQKIIDMVRILVTSSGVLNGIVLATLIMVIPIVVVIFLVAPASINVNVNITSKDSAEQSAYKIETLNKVLYSALQTIAIIVVFSVLTSSALSESIKATFTLPGFDILPPQACYAYGLLFASFLGIVYIPIQVFLKQRSDVLKKSLVSYYNDLEQKDDKWFDRVYAIININGTSLDVAKKGLTVIAPLLSSFVPELIKFIGHK